MVHATAFTKLSNLVMSQAMTLDERLACIFSPEDIPGISREDVHSFNGFSGYNFWIEDELVGQLQIASLLSGTYVIHKKIQTPDETQEVYDYYDASGNFFYQSSTLDGEAVKYGSLTMDTTSPFLNHIYNILNLEYEGASFNYGNTSRIIFLEKILRSIYNNDEIPMSLKQGRHDPALKHINKEILEIENDTVLKWNERQQIFKALKDVKRKIIGTKKRAHSLSFFGYVLPAILVSLTLKFHTFKSRPLNNLKGLLYRHTIGHVQWFMRTVNQNLGLSIAMAIYGPFTFYFITQPMNPHAMWAVGKVRGAYIEVVESMSGDTKKDDGYIDSIDTKAAATEKVVASAGEDWQKRMDQFKAMQINYEESMVFAARIGRVEQFETQFNFPLTAEAAWMEMELYLTDIEHTKKNNNLTKKYREFLDAEEGRTIELQAYIWKKMGQFFLDHPYIVVDQDNEQTERNYYVGRQFILFQNMTEKLAKLEFEQPKTHALVKTLASKFKSAKLEGNSILDTLKKNSKMFRQENLFDSDEQRKYMARQWEMMFLQQNKKQEAASFALQTYTWSIKNAIWILQTFTSAKRSELALMTNKFNMNNSNTLSIKPVKGMNEYLENMFHNLTMEYVSIKKEMVNNLGEDKETALREGVINNLKSYLLDRDKLFNNGIYAKNEVNTI